MVKEYLEHEDVKYIENAIIALAETHGYNLSDNLTAIARAKYRFFGVDNWNRCPCDRDNLGRFCCSTQCQKDVRESGSCHCSLFRRKE